jgi:RNA polymerase sigma-70 factor, ECF subfamily
LAGHDRAGYEALAQAHYARLRRLCVILLGDVAEAEEVVQDVFVKAWQISAAGAPNDWAAWLTRVALNACHDRRRAGWWRRFRRFSEWIENVPLHVEEPSPADVAFGEETRQRLWRAFRALSARQREVFVLRFIEELPTAQVAATLGLGEGSVKRHLFRAIRRLRVALGDLQ